MSWPIANVIRTLRKPSLSQHAANDIYRQEIGPDSNGTILTSIHGFTDIYGLIKAGTQNLQGDKSA